MDNWLKAESRMQKPNPLKTVIQFEGTLNNIMDE